MKYYAKNKRSQVTMFVIIGVLIVVLILLFLLLRGDIKPQISKKTNFDPETYVDLCLEDDLTASLNKISSQGGYAESNLTINYGGKDVAYLCYNINNYQRCINQEPLLLRHLQNEIHDDIEEELKNCFLKLNDELEKEDFTADISVDDLSFDVELVPDRVILKINNEFVISKDGEKRKLENIKVVKMSKFYDLSSVVQEIISQESWFCNFEQTGYMVLYPDYDIEKFRAEDSSTIYSIKHKTTNEEFVFAVRGCGIPPGIG
ncbi:hypothetical protein COU57_04030 [Candidatus Pacearchaeota archaeon CG10_big_fil_rev_8_21_14_0_10_32_14]|nr:MAG: hypothetical protein COU57_04030 [Candidatus Pacearchaeota archaeon CG10_big_fil_rev_8_21_14_0_10_32_14]